MFAHTCLLASAHSGYYPPSDYGPSGSSANSGQESAASGMSTCLDTSGGTHIPLMPSEFHRARYQPGMLMRRDILVPPSQYYQYFVRSRSNSMTGPGGRLLSPTCSQMPDGYMHSPDQYDGYPCRPHLPHYSLLKSKNGRMSSRPVYDSYDHHHHQQQQQRKPVDYETSDNGRDSEYEQDEFDIFNAIFALISLTSYTICFFTSLALAYCYYANEGAQGLAALTALAVLVSCIVVNILSFKW